MARSFSMGPKPKPTPVKYCEYCGEKIERRQYTRKKEDLTVFAKRKYCSRECMRKAYIKKDGSSQLYSPAHHSSRKIAYLINQKERVCEICGSAQNIDVHHKDGDFHNNTSDNLLVVCRSCHMKLHRPKASCRICGDPVKGHGLCEKHYQRFKKYGDPLHVPWSSYNRKNQ